MRRRLLYIRSTLILAILQFLGFGVESCKLLYGPDPDELDPIKPDSICPERDINYKGTVSDIIGQWQGEYSGWDYRQKCITNIRHLLTINEDGTYSKFIQGILVGKAKDKTEFTTFEKENGKYSFNFDNQSVIFTMSQDSLINYETGELEYQDQKFEETITYKTNVWFTSNESGERYWIQVDSTMNHPKNDKDFCVYILKRIK